MKTLAIVFDLDGTLNDFKKIDHEIMMLIFAKDQKLPWLIRIIDHVMWSVNKLDWMGNSMKKLLFRFRILSLLSGYTVEDIFHQYKKWYQKKTIPYLKEKEKSLWIPLEERKIKMIVLSNNGLSCGMRIGTEEVITVSSKERRLEQLKGLYSVIYMVGNNYQDDIKVAREVRDIIPVYVGKSPIVRICMKKDEILINKVEEIIKHI